MIKLIIGLGNPDKKYQNTYHNVGHIFVNFLLKSDARPAVCLIMPSTAYMNQSGSFVAQALKKCTAKAEELLIIHDDSDLALGRYKLQFGRGAAGHHGVENIIQTLKTKNFWRLRIGIRPVTESYSPQGQSIRKKAGEFVLKKITTKDKKVLNQVFETILNDSNFKSLSS